MAALLAFFGANLFSLGECSGESFFIGEKFEVKLREALSEKNGSLARFPVYHDKKTYLKESSEIRHYLKSVALMDFNKDVKAAILNKNYYFLVWVSCQVHDRNKVLSLLNIYLDSLNDSDKFGNAIYAFCVERMLISPNLLKNNVLDLDLAKLIRKFVVSLRINQFEDNKFIRLKDIDVKIMQSYFFNSIPKS